MRSLKGSAFWNWLREEPDHEPVVLRLDSEEEVLRIACTFIGQVQGVGFRYVLSEAAEVFGLVGYAYNRPDGSVDAQLQGRPLDMENAISYVQMLSPYILIDSMEWQIVPTELGDRRFVTG